MATQRAATESELVKLSVFDTAADKERLKALVQSLRRDPGYGQGIAVREDEVPGIYIVDLHRGEITDHTGRIRVVENQVWTKSYDWMVTRLLFNNRIPYVAGEITLDAERAMDKDAKPIVVTELGRICIVLFQ
jgi:hypothetical protein